jgi:hypothetical protein
MLRREAPSDKDYVELWPRPLPKLKRRQGYRPLGYCHNVVTSLGKIGTLF